MSLFDKAIIIIWIAVFLFIFDYLKGPKNIESVLHTIEEFANMTKPTQILFSHGKVNFLNPKSVLSGIFIACVVIKLSW